MTSFLCLLGSSCALCLVLVPGMRALARRVGLVDRPDGRRKIHGRAVPLVGGLAIFTATTLTLAAALLVPHEVQEPLQEQAGFLTGLLLAVAILCGVGVADDLGWLRARHKLLGQALAVGVLMAYGVLVNRMQLFGWRIELGILAVPFTAFLLLGAINSLNLIDGMDGLLGSVAGIICLALAAMAALAGHWAMAAIAVALAGSLVGFLCYNFPPASIFLGDSGSMIVGLVVGTLAIQCSLKAPATVALTMPVVLLTLPIFDTAAAILRRKLTGRSIYATDRGHLHHCLLRRGLSVRAVLLLVSVFSAATGLSVLASQAFNNEWIALVTALAVVGILMATGLFGWAEAVLVKQRLRALAWQLFAGRESGKAVQHEVRLQGTADWREVWQALVATAERLNLQQLCLDVNAPALHESYHARWARAHEDGEVPTLWRAALPITVAGSIVGRLEIAAVPDAQPVWSKIAAITRAVSDIEQVVAHLATAAPAAAPVLVPEPV
jgi:UDP-GlcNAc:undecaprenyl-phosphate GlcNAc-1-phosphate transferase